jgi:hypothetical protein
MLTEEKRSKGYVRAHTTDVIETPYTRDRRLEIVSSHNDQAVNLNLYAMSHRPDDGGSKHL